MKILTSNAVLLLCCTTLYGIAAQFTSHVNVGIMYPKLDDNGRPHTYGLQHLTGVQIALDHINNKADGIADDLLPGVELRLVARSPPNTFTAGAKAAMEIITAGNESGIIACVGTGEEESLKGSTFVFADYSIPVVGHSVDSVALSRSFDYPNILMTNPLEIYAAFPIADILVSVGWRRVTVFYSEDGEGYGTNSELLFRQRAVEFGINILSTHGVISGQEREAVVSAKAVGANIFILLTTIRVTVPLLQAGHELGLFGIGKQIIGGERISRIDRWEGERVNITSAERDKLLFGFIGLRWDRTMSLVDSDMLPYFVNSWYNLNSTAGKGQPAVCDNGMDYYGEFALYEQDGTCSGLDYSSFSTKQLYPAYGAYDAVFAIARGYHALIQSGDDSVTSSALHDYMLQSLIYEGLTGTVTFETTYENIDFYTGGRTGDVTYRIINYDGEFNEKATWNSLDGLGRECELDIETECLEFVFNTFNKLPPFDRPQEKILEYPQLYRTIMYIICSVNIAILLFYAICLFSFRQRRIVKITQPQLSYIILLGGLLLCITAFISTTARQTEAACSAMYWLTQMGFGFIYIVLALKLWRVHAVSGTMTKKVVGLKDVYIRLVACTLVIVVTVLAVQLIGIKVVKETVVEDQFAYERHLICQYDEVASNFSSVVIYLILFAGLCLCYLTRNVDSTLSNSTASAKAILYGTCCVILVELLSLVGFDPYTYILAEQCTVMAVVAYIFSVLYSRLCFKLLLGADLDRSLTETHTSWSILDSRAVAVISALLFRRSQGVKTVDASASGESAEAKARLKKYANLSGEQLANELKALKEKMSELKTEMIVVENFKFTQGEISSSSSAHAYAAPDDKGESKGGGHV